MNYIHVIIPVYNAKKYLRDTVQSVLNQPYKGIDIVLVDDLEEFNVSNVWIKGELVAKDIKDADVTSIGKVTDIFTGLAANQYDVAIVDLGVAKNYAKKTCFITYFLFQ